MESRGPSLVRRGMIAAALLAAVAAPSVLLAQAAAPAPPKLEDVAKAVADNGAALNMVWTLVAGFLVMFMQAGFALVETGFTRAKNAGHTMTMNFMVYAIGMLGVLGRRLRHPDGRRRRARLRSAATTALNIDVQHHHRRPRRGASSA